MSMKCEITLRWNATPEQLTALGTALWRWCNRPPRNTDIYQHLDNQALADLLAGKLPASSQGACGGVHLRLRDEASHERQTTLAGLRRALPTKGIEDIVVEGQSWNVSLPG